MRPIYVDHAATTPLRPEVLRAMLPYLEEHFGNPSSIHSPGRRARTALDETRERVAAALGARHQEIVLTAGGTDANNLAIQGVALAQRERGNHIVVSSVEHHSVLDTALFMQRLGFEVTQLSVDRVGRVVPEALKEAIRLTTVLISVMHANNEVGTIQPIGVLSEIAHERGILFHTDAVQSVGTLPVQVDRLGCDLLTLSAHKFGGPKGAGALYVRRNTPLVPHLHGGGQERNRRAGTQNVAGAVGMAEALQLALLEQDAAARHLRNLRARLVQGLTARIPNVVVNDAGEDKTLPGLVSLCFPGIEGESLLMNLDMQGVAASSGSACTSGSLEPSHVLLAMGLPVEVAKGSLRVSLGRSNIEEEIDRLLDILPGIVERLYKVRASVSETTHCF